MQVTDGFILGFDYGTKRIGIALGTVSIRQARPLLTVHIKKDIPWAEIDKVIQTWSPRLLLVGIPLNMDGTEQSMTHRARDFSQQLKERYRMAIQEMDERLSSCSAREALFDAGGYSALQDGQVDAMAAKLLIDHWFLESFS